MKPRLREIPNAEDRRLDDVLKLLHEIAHNNSPTLFDTIVAAFTALGYALSARALLLLSLIGAFVLAVKATTVMDLAILTAYSVFGVLPIVVLEVRKRKEG